MSIKIAVLISGLHGRGSNMESIVKNCLNQKINGQVKIVIGNYKNSPALARADSYSIPTKVIKSPQLDDETSSYGYGEKILETLEQHQIDLICLAGYMRKLPDNVLDVYAGRIMNIHNGLLPAFGGKGMYGLRVHQSVLDYGSKISGCTVHFVDNGYDTGPIILQSVVPVEDDDTAETLAARVLVEEHKTYPEAISLFSKRKLKIEGRRVRILK